jgi:hypothetical protein
VSASRPRYRQTFRQHRKLLIAPIVIASVIAAYFSFSAPPVYRSVAAVWVDNSPAVSSAMDDSVSAASSATASQIDPGADGAGSPTTAAATPNGPAGLEAQVLYELLLSPQFDVQVGHGSLLPRYLTSAGSAASSVADDEAATELAPKIEAWATGPQVLQLSYDGPSAAVSRSVLQSVIKQMGAAGSAFGDTLGKTASSFYSSQLTTAQTELVGNEGSLASYARKHPGANAGNDATYRALANEVQLAESHEASVAAASNQANTEASSGGGSATIKVIDQPSLPAGPTTGLTAKLTGVIGGAFAGLVVSLVALILLTPRSNTRWDADVPAFLRLAAWDRTRRRIRPPAGPRETQAPRPRHDPPPQEEGA